MFTSVFYLMVSWLPAIVVIGTTGYVFFYSKKCVSLWFSFLVRKAKRDFAHEPQFLPLPQSEIACLDPGIHALSKSSSREVRIRAPTYFFL